MCVGESQRQARGLVGLAAEVARRTGSGRMMDYRMSGLRESSNAAQFPVA